MARRRKWEEEDAPPVRPGFGARLRYLTLILLTLVLITYAALQAMARTAGFRDLVGQQLENRLGMPVKIEGSTVNWRFDLTLANLVTEGTKRPDSPGLRARRIHFAWSLSGFWRTGIGVRAVELDQASVVFKQEEDGTWAPREFQTLSDVLGPWLEFDLQARPATNLASTSTATETKPPAPEKPEPAKSWSENLKDSGIRVALSNCDLTWWDDAAVPRATVQGVGLRLTPVEVPGRTLHHLTLQVRQAMSQRGDQVRNLHVEVLDAGTQKVILGFEAERQQGTDPRP